MPQEKPMKHERATESEKPIYGERKTHSSQIVVAFYLLKIKFLTLDPLRSRISNDL